MDLEDILEHLKEIGEEVDSLEFEHRQLQDNCSRIEDTIGTLNEMIEELKREIKTEFGN